MDAEVEEVSKRQEESNTSRKLLIERTREFKNSAKEVGLYSPHSYCQHVMKEEKKRKEQTCVCVCVCAWFDGWLSFSAG